MTAEFFFKDESSVKARQTVFFAYKSPEAGSSLAREGETLMRCHPIWGNMWQKLAVGRCNATHKWFRLLNTDIPGFVCVCTCCTTLPKKGIVCSVCLCMCICTSSVGKNSHMMFCCKFPWHLDQSSTPPPPPTPPPHISMQKSLSVRNDDNFGNASTAAKLAHGFG